MICLTTTEDKKKAASMEKPNLDALRGEIDEYIKTLRDGLKLESRTDR